MTFNIMCRMTKTKYLKQKQLCKVNNASQGTAMLKRVRMGNTVINQGN